MEGFRAGEGGPPFSKVTFCINTSLLRFQVCGASLQGHRKCSQGGCPLVNGNLGESALEGYT